MLSQTREKTHKREVKVVLGVSYRIPVFLLFLMIYIFPIPQYSEQAAVTTFQSARHYLTGDFCFFAVLHSNVPGSPNSVGAFRFPTAFERCMNDSHNTAGPRWCFPKKKNLSKIFHKHHSWRQKLVQRTKRPNQRSTQAHGSTQKSQQSWTNLGCSPEPKRTKVTLGQQRECLTEGEKRRPF